MLFEFLWYHPTSRSLDSKTAVKLGFFKAEGDEFKSHQVLIYFSYVVGGMTQVSCNNIDFFFYVYIYIYIYMYIHINLLHVLLCILSLSSLFSCISENLPANFLIFCKTGHMKVFDLISWTLSPLTNSSVTGSVAWFKGFSFFFFFFFFFFLILFKKKKSFLSPSLMLFLFYFLQSFPF